MVVDVQKGDLAKVLLEHHDERVGELENLGEVKQPNMLGELVTRRTPIAGRSGVGWVGGAGETGGEMRSVSQPHTHANKR